MTADTSNEETLKKHRPRGVTLVALYYLAIGIISLLIASIFFVVIIDAFMPGPCKGCAYVIGGFILISVITFVVALIYIPIGIGLLKLKSWAQKLAIIIAFISPLFFTIFIVRIITRDFPFWLILVAINLICVIYLLTKGSRRAFRNAADPFAGSYDANAAKRYLG